MEVIKKEREWGKGNICARVDSLSAMKEVERKEEEESEAARFGYSRVAEPGQLPQQISLTKQSGPFLLPIPIPIPFPPWFAQHSNTRQIVVCGQRRRRRQPWWLRILLRASMSTPQARHRRLRRLLQLQPNSFQKSCSPSSPSTVTMRSSSSISDTLLSHLAALRHPARRRPMARTPRQRQMRQTGRRARVSVSL